MINTHNHLSDLFVIKSYTFTTRITFMIMFYLVFLVLGLYHGLNGVWAVIRDYHMSAGVRKFIFGIIVAVGIFIGALGFITMLTLPTVQ